jgi:hypothetical protein
MAIADLTTHPFQAFDLTVNPDWQGIVVNTADDAYFESQTRVLEDAFRHALEHGGFRRFVETYIRVSKDMLGHGRAYPMLRALLQDALARLTHYYIFVRRRTRASLATDGSSYVWQIPPALLAKAQAAAAEQERDNVMVRDYDLGADPAMKAWVMENVYPVVQGYVGSAAVRPWGQIRYADAAKHGELWSYIYDRHPFAYFHLDERLYSLPLIIYLNDVDETTGAFSYVEGTDKIPQNWVLRSFHQAVFHGSNVICHSDADRRTIAGLPGVFHGGDLVGTFTGPERFENFKIVRVTGPAGTALMSDGFQLVHAGGHPKVGARKALFIVFRYPQKRVGDLLAFAISKYWSWRVGSVVAP